MPYKDPRKKTLKWEGGIVLRGLLVAANFGQIEAAWKAAHPGSSRSAGIVQRCFSPWLLEGPSPPTTLNSLLGPVG